MWAAVWATAGALSGDSGRQGRRWEAGWRFRSISGFRSPTARPTAWTAAASSPPSNEDIQYAVPLQNNRAPPTTTVELPDGLFPVWVVFLLWGSRAGAMHPEMKMDMSTKKKDPSRRFLGGMGHRGIDTQRTARCPPPSTPPGGGGSLW